jgi:hypothetical protein
MVNVIVSQNSAVGALKSLEEEIEKTRCAKTAQLEYDMAQLKKFIGQAGGARKTGRKSRKGRKTQRKTRGRK